MNLSIYWRPI